MPSIKRGGLTIECATAQETAEVAYHLERLEQAHPSNDRSVGSTSPERPSKNSAHETPLDRALALLEHVQAYGKAISSRDLAKHLGYTNGRVLSPILMACEEVFEAVGGQEAVLRRRKQRIGSLYSPGPRISEAIARLREEASAA